MRVFSILAIGSLCYAALLSSSSRPSDANGTAPLQAPDLSERYPPLVDKIWVQKPKTPTPKGEDLIFRVRYVLDQKLPSTLTIFLDDSTKILLNDVGTAPDIAASDNIYSAYVKCSTDDLASALLQLEAKWRDKKRIILFNGHVGAFVAFEEVKPFDKSAFLENKEVEIDHRLLDAEECDAELLKERSLFITDISVVKDALRTYDPVTGIGNPTGVWTFGTLMNNISNGQHPQGTRGLLKDFVRHWVQPQNINGTTVAPRGFVLVKLVQPWLRKANADPLLDVTVSNWEALWDATSEVELKKQAPFRLTAIVDRIDVRGNSAYSASLNSTGETRFIFTLIDLETGSIAINPNQTASSEQNGVGLVDWRGLNVIFEYQNVQNTRCETRDYAQQWLNLSETIYAFGTPSENNPYKTALQAITDQVTLANAAPNRTNGSALGRIRTNEKVFAQVLGETSSESAWEKQDWEFRQLELDPNTHSLVLAPLTNTPPHTANDAPNILENYSTANPPVTNTELLSWIYDGNRSRVVHGNFNIPTELLSGSGIVRREQAQYLDFNPLAFEQAGNYPPDVESSEAKTIRHQLSLNTCAGCHAGETKTVFTHVNPLSNTEEAKYWNTTLDGAANIPQDAAFYPGGTGPLQLGGRNWGSTMDIYLNSAVGNLNAVSQIERRNFFQHVSPFLTGRRYLEYTAPEYGDPTWEDDEEDNLNSTSPNPEADDSGMDGFFYVNDPSNNLGNEFPYIGNRKNGFNDLERRKADMCAFLNADCSGSIRTHPVAKMIALIRFIPLPEAGH